LWSRPRKPDNHDTVSAFAANTVGNYAWSARIGDAVTTATPSA
jgi:hypothetical protein